MTRLSAQGKQLASTAYAMKTSKRLYRSAERQKAAGEWWIAKRVAQIRLGKISNFCLTRWIMSCPHLPGKAGIRTKELGDGLGQLRDFCAEKDVKDAADNKTTRRANPVPEYGDLVHVDDARKELDRISGRTLRRLRAEYGESIIKLPGMDKKGRWSSSLLSFVTRAFVDKCKADRAVPEGKVSTAEASKKIGCSADRVRLLGESLGQSTGNASGTFEQGRNGKKRKMRAVRPKCLLFDLEKVESTVWPPPTPRGMNWPQWKDLREIATNPTSAGLDAAKYGLNAKGKPTTALQDFFGSSPEFVGDFP